MAKRSSSEIFGITQEDLAGLGIISHSEQAIQDYIDGDGPVFAAAYIRVSTKDQVDLSPESQLEEIRKYAQRNGIILLQDHIYIDPGISGKHADNRPKFQEVIAQAKSPDCPFQVILVWKFARFARNQLESIFYKSILRSKCGVSVVSITEPLPEGPFGSLIERIIEWMDEFYSYRLSGEVKRSMTVNAQNGVFQSSPPFGYRLDKEKHVLTIVDDEAQHVRFIFDSFLAGDGFYPIAKKLNDMGVRTHRGNRFANRTVEYILRNPVYIGKLRWNPTGRTRYNYDDENIIVADASHEHIIDDDTFNAVQTRVSKIKAQWGYKARPTYELKHWLSGIVRCSNCGSTLVFTKPCYFKCNNYVRGKCKHSQHIKADILADAIISKLREDAASSKKLNYSMAYAVSSAGKEVSRLEATCRLIETKKERLQEAYLAGVIELSDFSDAKKRMESDLENAAADLEAARLKMETGASTDDAMRRSIETALEVLESSSATIDAKNNAARSVIERCVFDKDAGTLSLTYRLVI